MLLGERLDSHVADHVGVDNRAAAAAVTQHLLDTGRRRIAVIGAGTVGELPVMRKLRRVPGVVADAATQVA